MNKGFFIALEGIDGSGKSTQFGEVAEILKKRGIYEVVTVREPGGTVLSERIRELLLTSKEGEGMDPEAELCLFLAARAQLLAEVIRPALERGAIVLADRFCCSTVAYQGAGRGLGVERVAAMCQEVCGSFLPNLNIFVEVSHEAAEKRRSNKSEDRMEREGRGFLERVEEGFKALLGTDLVGETIAVSGEGSISEVTDRIIGEIDKRTHYPRELGHDV